MKALVNAPLGSAAMLAITACAAPTVAQATATPTAATSDTIPSAAGQATSGSSASGSAPSSAGSTQAGPSETDETQAAGLNDIIVTANKRSERALEVPGAITAFRGDDLLASGQTSIRDFAAQTPGLQFNNGVGSAAPIIRGLSIGIDTSPTVAIVVNGAPVGSSSSLNFGAQETLDLDPIDIDRVEVLKGPQGTIYALIRSAGFSPIRSTIRASRSLRRSGAARFRPRAMETSAIPHGPRSART